MAAVVSEQSTANMGTERIPPASDPSEGNTNCRARLDAVIRRFHGEVGSPLAALGLRLELIRTDKSLDPAVAMALESASADLALVIDCVRESVAELRALGRDSLTPDSH